MIDPAACSFRKKMLYKSGHEESMEIIIFYENEIPIFPRLESLNKSTLFSRFSGLGWESPEGKERHRI